MSEKLATAGMRDAPTGTPSGNKAQLRVCTTYYLACNTKQYTTASFIPYGARLQQSQSSTNPRIAVHGIENSRRRACRTCSAHLHTRSVISRTSRSLGFACAPPAAAAPPLPTIISIKRGERRVGTSSSERRGGTAACNAISRLPAVVFHLLICTRPWLRYTFWTLCSILLQE